MPIATLSIDLEARLARLENDLQRATRLVEQQAGRMESSFGKAATTLKGLTGLLSADMAVRWMVDFVRITTNGLDKLNDLHDATGSSVENLSALEDIAARTGTSIETAGSALVKFNKELTDAKPGSEQAEIFKRLGLDAAELRKIDPAEALLRTAQALATFADDGSKARYIQALFAKSVQEAAPFLKDLAEAGQLNATVTTAQADAAEKFNKQLFDLQKNSQDAGRAILSEMLPALTEVLARWKALKESFGGGLSGLAAGLSEPAFRDAGEAIDHYTKKLRDLQQARAAETRPLMLAYGEADYKAEVARINKFLDFYTRTASAMGKLGAGAGRGLVNPESAAGKAPSIGDLPPKSGGGEGTSEVEKYAKKLEDATVAALDLSNAEKLAFDISAGRLPGLTAAQQDYLETLAKGIDDLKLKIGAMNTPLEAFRTSELSAAEGVNKALDDEKLKRWNDQRDRFNALIAATPTAKLEETRADMLALAAALERGTISEQQFTEAAQTRLGTLPDVLQKSTQMAEELGTALSDAAGSALMNFGSLGDVLASLEKQLIQIVLQQTVLNPFKTWITSKLIGFGFADGGAFDGGKLVPFANGGVVDSPHLFRFANGGAMSTGVMGEAGPEAVIPLQRGPGGKLGVRGGGGVTVIQHNTFQGGASANELAAWSVATKQATINAIVDAQRRGRTLQ